MIISVRGTSGSGKSYLVRRVMALLPEPQKVEHLGREVGLLYPRNPPLFLFGRYVEGRTSAGADLVGGELKVREARFKFLEDRVKQEDLLFEGLMDSNEVTRTITLKRQHPTHIIFLNTPLQDCLAAINARRAAKGNMEPVSLKKTTEKFEELKRVRHRLKDAGVATYFLDREAAFLKVCELLGVGP